MSLRILTVVGARPQFIKAAVLSAEFERRPEIEEILVHTGQHYDYQMSGTFFDELGIREPTMTLDVGSGSHAYQTGTTMMRLEPIVQEYAPAWIVVYGDTNATLAGALVAAKAKIPLAHVEAGLRCFNRDVPEEVNRVVTDHLAALSFAPNDHSAQLLRAEGIVDGVHVVGDLMLDLLYETVRTLPPIPALLTTRGIAPRDYALMTIHRPQNTDDPAAFARIITAVRQAGLPVLFPVHPRSRPAAHALGVGEGDGIVLCEPLGYKDMIAAQACARVVVTDSGGVQKEAAALGTPCVTLREDTEWVETVASGRNVLVGTDVDRIVQAIAAAQQRTNGVAKHDVRVAAAKHIADVLLAHSVKSKTLCAY